MNSRLTLRPQWRLSIFTIFHVTSAQSLSNHEAHCNSPSQKNPVECDLFLFSKHQSKNLGASQMLFHSLPLWKAVLVTHHTVLRQRNEKCEKSSNLVAFFWLKLLWLHGRQWPSSLPVTVEIYIKLRVNNINPTFQILARKVKVFQFSSPSPTSAEVPDPWDLSLAAGGDFFPPSPRSSCPPCAAGAQVSPSTTAPPTAARTKKKRKARMCASSVSFVGFFRGDLVATRLLLWISKFAGSVLCGAWGLKTHNPVCLRNFIKLWWEAI